MLIDDCSEFRGHRLKSCSRCGHQFDWRNLTRLNPDQLNAIKDKEWQFGFRWKLSDLAVGEAVIVDLCPSCYADVVNLIDANEQVDKLTVGYASEHPDFLAKQLIIPMCNCQICHKELPKHEFVDIQPEHYIASDILTNPDDYFVRWSKSKKQSFLDILSRSAYVKVCPQCYSSLCHEYLCNESRRLKLEPYAITLNELHDKLPVYIKGKSYGDAKQDSYKITEEELRKWAPALDDLWSLNKDKNGIYINLEERKMKNVNETKNQNHAFAIERNYDETDRKLFRLEDAETGDFIRLATDEERLIYMVVNIAPVKNRVKVNEKSGSNCVWCVCIQTQDLVELNGDEMVYVYDPRSIAFRIGRFIDA